MVDRVATFAAGTVLHRLRLAHCSDIHLDADMHSGQSRQSDHYRAGFSRVLDEMLLHDPDLLLIAGDLFDSNRASHATIEWAMNTLGEVPRPIVMIPGNHDCLEKDAIYRRHDFGHIDNVTPLLAEDGELASFPDLGAAVWGRGMVDHHPGYIPLEGCPEKPSHTRWYVGLGHGIFVPRGESTHRSSPVRMEEIDASPCDYIALGHHHAALDVSGTATAATYSGSPTDSFGGGKTYTIVDLTPDSPACTTIHLLADDA